VTGGTPFDIDNRSFNWDKMHNKTAVNDLRAGPQDSRLLQYDSAYRMVRSRSVSGRPTLDYALDPAGNRAAVAGGPDAGPYAMNATLPEPADSEMNQYTSTPFDSRTYDRNGNLIGDGVRQFHYDYRNRLIDVIQAGAVQASYRYDVFGRRVEKNVAGRITRHYYDEGQEIEEQDATGATLATFVWGGEPNEMVEMNRGSQRYFSHADDLGSVMAVTDGAGNLVAQYLYGDYGTPEFFNGSGESLGTNAVDNPFLFTGHRYDAETGFLYCQTRYLDPRAGRFLTRDTIGIWGDEENLGNGYNYVGDNPFSAIDPYGTKGWFKKQVQKIKVFEKKVEKRVEKAAKKLGQAAMRADKKLRSVNWKDVDEAARKIVKVNVIAVKLPILILRFGAVLINDVVNGTKNGAFEKGPFYGYWCGKGNKVDANGQPYPPLDQLDQCCKTHDLDPSHPDPWSVAVTIDRGTRRANEALSECAKCVTDCFSKECNAARQDIIFTFGGRVN
jgi:RHS repeat-associated protein